MTQWPRRLIASRKLPTEIHDAMERIGNFDGVSEFRAKLTDIKDKQSKLGQQYSKASKGQIGKKPDQLTPEKRAELEKIAQEQKDLARQTEATLEQMNKKADQVRRTDSTSAQAMKQAAQTGNQQQVPGKQQQASQSMQQNQQAQAEQAAQQAEIGLQMVISKLAEAERRARHPHQVLGVTLIENRKILRQTGGGSVGAKQSVRGRVEGAAVHARARAAREPRDSPEHLLRRAAREGEEENAVGRHAAAEQMRDAIDEGAGLPRPCRRMRRG